MKPVAFAIFLKLFIFVRLIKRCLLQITFFSCLCECLTRSCVFISALAVVFYVVDGGGCACVCVCVSVLNAYFHSSKDIR